MRDLQKIKDVIKKYIPDGKCGIYDCEGDTRDYKNKVYDDGEVVILNCRAYEYIEVLGLTDEEFRVVEKYYNSLRRR